MATKAKLVQADYDVIKQMMKDCLVEFGKEFGKEFMLKLDAIYGCVQKRGQNDAMFPQNVNNTNNGNPLQVDAVILGDSMTSAISKTGISQLCNKSASVKSISGVVPCDLIVPSDVTNPKDIVIHVGTACISNNNPEVECYTAPEIATEITETLDQIASVHTDTKVHFSSMVHRTDIRDKHEKYEPVNEIIDAANGLVKVHCESKDIAYIDNANIELSDLHDGVHLNVPGAQKFARNIATSLRGTNTVTPRTRSRAIASGGPKQPSPFHRVKVPINGERPDMRRSRYNNPTRMNAPGSSQNRPQNNGQYNVQQWNIPNSFPPPSYANPNPSSFSAPSYANPNPQRRNGYQNQWPRNGQDSHRPRNTNNNTNNDPMQADHISAAINNLLNAFSGGM